MPAIKTGSKVPEFSLPTTGGGTWSLKDAAGRKLVIYFYPRDMTSGCTREAQDFRDLYGAFGKEGVEIVGVSCRAKTPSRSLTLSAPKTRIGIVTPASRIARPSSMSAQASIDAPRRESRARLLRVNRARREEEARQSQDGEGRKMPSHSKFPACCSRRSRRSGMW